MTDIKKIGMYLLIIILCTFCFVLIFKYPNLYNQFNILALVLTLGVLIWYAYDTHRIANQTIESNLRPIVLRNGLNIEWRFKSIDNDMPDIPFLELVNLKNIAMNISGHIIIKGKKYNLLFGLKYNDNNLNQQAIKFINSQQWQWLPSNTQLFASFDKNKFSNVKDNNEIYLMYQDIEGNSYFTKEDSNYLQVTGKL